MTQGFSLVLVLGMHTWFLMIADPRIVVGAPLIGVQVGGFHSLHPILLPVLGFIPHSS